MDFALLPVHNSQPAGQLLFGRFLRCGLPESEITLEVFTLPHNAVTSKQIYRKLQQKQAYGKYVGPLLCELPLEALSMPFHLLPHQLRPGSLER